MMFGEGRGAHSGNKLIQPNGEVELHVAAATDVCPLLAAECEQSCHSIERNGIRSTQDDEQEWKDEVELPLERNRPEDVIDALQIPRDDVVKHHQMQQQISFFREASVDVEGSKNKQDRDDGVVSGIDA